MQELHSITGEALDTHKVMIKRYIVWGGSWLSSRSLYGEEPAALRVTRGNPNDKGSSSSLAFPSPR